jgi:hypothetical protein
LNPGEATNEIGGRTAPGADRLEMVRLILKRVMRLTGMDILIWLVFRDDAYFGRSTVRDQGRRTSYHCFRCPLLGCCGVHLVLRASVLCRFDLSGEIASSGIVPTNASIVIQFCASTDATTFSVCSEWLVIPH